MDILYAYTSVNGVLSTLTKLRMESVTEFKRIFTESTRLGKQLNCDAFELSTPRLAGDQSHRNNPPVSSPEDYFRITLYDEFLSHVTAELEERFTPGNQAAQDIVNGLLYLLPSKCACLEDDYSFPAKLKLVVDFYSSDLPNPPLLPTEYCLWVLKWKQQDSSELPMILVDVFQACSSLQFPNIHVLLYIALTLPITSYESEWSFSQLKLIKTTLRSTMSEGRLSGLSLMKINLQKCNEMTQSQTKMNKLVDLYAQTHSRRMKLSFTIADIDQ
jgi:hypothetical protein